MNFGGILSPNCKLKPSTVRQYIRYISTAILLVVTAGVCHWLFLKARWIIAGAPMRIYILPNNFIGTFVILEDIKNGQQLTQTGFWHTQVILRVPPSGILHVRNINYVHNMAREKFIYEDGRILDGTSPWGSYPSRVQFTGSVWESANSNWGSTVPIKQEYLGATDSNGRIHYVSHEVLPASQETKP